VGDSCETKSVRNIPQSDDERGSRNEKVVSSVDTSSVTIFILHQSPFRFAATAALRCCGGNGFLPRRAPTRGTPTYFHSSSATGFPLASIRESAIFRGRFRHASDDEISPSLSLSLSFSLFGFVILYFIFCISNED